MKCIENVEKEIKKVTDAEADAMVGKGWSYCSREKWKKATRGAVKEAPKRSVETPEQPHTDPQTKKVGKAKKTPKA